MTDFRCSEAAFSRDEPMFATASQVQRWLVVEQSGPFSAESLPTGRISPAALTALSRLARRDRARLVLIRHPPGLAAEAGLRVFYANSRPGEERLVSLLVDDVQALCELTLQDPAWALITEPIYLVCTHGKHDPCCALRGRPIVAALSQELASGRVWECSHVGGDRFAGNVVALPSGLYLGRVEPEEAVSVAGIIDSGRVPVHYLRGRSSLSGPAQAAQHFARTEANFGSLDGIGDLLPKETTASPDYGPDAWTVTLQSPEGDLLVTVQRRLSAEPVQLTCHSTEPKYYPQFTLLKIRYPRRTATATVTVTLQVPP